MKTVKLSMLNKQKVLERINLLIALLLEREQFTSSAHLEGIKAEIISGIFDIEPTPEDKKYWYKEGLIKRQQERIAHLEQGLREIGEEHGLPNTVAGILEEEPTTNDARSVTEIERDYLKFCEKNPHHETYSIHAKDFETLLSSEREWRVEAMKNHPTQDAYKAACKALWKHRVENERLKAENERLKTENAMLERDNANAEMNLKIVNDLREQAVELLRQIRRNTINGTHQTMIDSFLSSLSQEGGKEEHPKTLKPRPEVEWFARQMEKKLRANDHKAHWSKLHMDYLIERLYQEAGELWRAIREGKPEDIVQEAADVGDFAMMIADNAERMGKP